jgi:hypothetical protein
MRRCSKADACHRNSEAEPANASISRGCTRRLAARHRRLIQLVGRARDPVGKSAKLADLSVNVRPLSHPLILCDPEGFCGDIVLLE